MVSLGTANKSEDAVQPANGKGQQARSDGFYYILAVVLGVAAGWVEVKIADLLFTAVLVLASCMLLGVLRPHRPWRWTALVAIWVPIADLLAYVFLNQRPDRAHIYGSFLAFLPAIVGAYGGFFLRDVVRNILSNQ